MRFLFNRSRQQKLCVCGRAEGLGMKCVVSGELYVVMHRAVVSFHPHSSNLPKPPEMGSQNRPQKPALKQNEGWWKEKEILDEEIQQLCQFNSSVW